MEEFGSLVSSTLTRFGPDYWRGRPAPSRKTTDLALDLLGRDTDLREGTNNPRQKLRSGMAKVAGVRPKICAVN